jgi:glycine cleavage system H lipoate-binding protein
MITGYSTVENAVEALHNGAIDFIPKPFTYEEITGTIQRAMAFSRIKNKITNSGSIEVNQQAYYLKCPPEYKMLGYWTWVKIENEGTAKIGATDLFVKTITGINKIELMPVEDFVIQGSACAQITTNEDINHNLLSSLSGRIVKRNEELIENPLLFEEDPHIRGWLYKIIPSDIDYEMKYLSSCNSNSI